MNDREIKMSYEEYKETTKDILKDMFKMSKEDYEKGIEFINYIASYEDKIENLASEIIPDNKICGYYIIIEYCFKQIKNNDKNIQKGFSTEINKNKEQK